MSRRDHTRYRETNRLHDGVGRHCGIGDERTRLDSLLIRDCTVNWRINIPKGLDGDIFAVRIEIRVAPRRRTEVSTRACRQIPRSVMNLMRLSPPTFPMPALRVQGGSWCSRKLDKLCASATSHERSPKRLANPSVGKRTAARLPTARDEGLGRLLSGAGLGAQELQQFGVDFLCMRPRDAVRTTLDDHEARA